MGLIHRANDTSLLTTIKQKIQFYKATHLMAERKDFYEIRPIYALTVEAANQYENQIPEIIQITKYEEFMRRAQAYFEMPGIVSLDPHDRIKSVFDIMDAPGTYHKAGYEFETKLAFGLCVRLAELGYEDLARYLDLEIERRQDEYERLY